jgi:hypothetical protein
MHSEDSKPMLVDIKRAAKIVGRAPSTLRGWYYEGRGPIATKVGASRQARLMYAIDDLVAWVRAGCPMDWSVKPATVPAGGYATPRGEDGRFVRRNLESIAS